MDKIAEIFSRIQAADILDIACGQGEFIAWIKHYLPDFEHLLAVDNNEKVLQRARDNSASDQRIDFSLMDAYHLNVPDNSFDLITLSNSLHHFQDHSKLFAEINRVLRSDGCLLINEMVADHLSLAQESHMRIHHFAAKLDRLKGQYHADTYQQAAVINLLKTAKFTLHSTAEYSFPLTKEAAAKQVKSLHNTLLQLLKKYEARADFAKLQTEAEEIKQWMQDHSFAPARSVLILAQPGKAL